MPVDNINDVLVALDAIIYQTHSEGSRFGYFAVLYRRVTRLVRDGIAAGRFQDGARMDRLDTVFARRYLEPYAAWRAGQPVPRCWAVAFDACSERLPCVLQHLAAGVNAHINFDLGVAAAEVAPGAELEALHADFLEVNRLLADETVAVENALARVSPALAALRDVALLDNNRILNFSMTKARDLAWATACEFAADPGDREGRLERLDAVVSTLGDAVLHPPPQIAIKLAPVRALEIHDVRRIIDVLA